MSQPTEARPRPPFSLEGRVALVTGAGRGLGFEMARALAKAGAQVVINGRDAARLRATANGIKVETGASVGIAPFDVGDVAAGAAALDRLVSEHGRLDILINNVGARDRRPLAAFSEAETQALVATDLIGPMMLARAAVAHMKVQRHGRLIFVTSIAGAVANRDDPVYTAAKAGLAGLMRAMAVDHAPDGITANAIAPGMFATETNAHLAADPDFVAFAKMRVPVGRMGNPPEIAAAAVFLASDEASFVNGHTLTVDGGQTIRM